MTALWSDWDVSLHHFGRYSKTTLRDLCRHPALEESHCDYINVAALPAVWLVRKLRAKNPSGSQKRMTDAPPAPLNGLLKAMFVMHACQSLIRFPAGVGLLAV